MPLTRDPRDPNVPPVPNTLVVFATKALARPDSLERLPALATTCNDCKIALCTRTRLASVSPEDLRADPTKNTTRDYATANALPISPELRLARATVSRLSPIAAVTETELFPASPVDQSAKKVKIYTVVSATRLRVHLTRTERPRALATTTRRKQIAKILVTVEVCSIRNDWVLNARMTKITCSVCVTERNARRVTLAQPLARAKETKNPTPLRYSKLCTSMSLVEGHRPLLH